MAELILQATGLVKRFGSTLAVAGVDFQVASGEIRALVGENGAGKSTLMKLLSGVFPPDEGEIRFDGRLFRPAGPGEARDAGVSMVHQELALAPHLGVAENLFLGMESSRFGVLRRAEMRARAREALSSLEHGDIPPEARVSSLSIAEQQIVEIARALLREARVLILDEPTSSLARVDVERLFRLLRGLASRGLAIVYISHFLEEVFEIADTYTVLRDGRSVGEGTIEKTSIPEIVRLMVGREIREMFPRTSRERGEVVLEVEGLRGARAPRSASFALHRGEVLGIAGLLGAGRTEMVRAIFGLDPVRAGKIRIGAFVGPAAARERLRQGAGLLSEDRKREGLAAIRSIDENLTLTRLDGLGPLGLVLPGRREAAARSWVDALGIQCRDPRQRVSELSGGNQQKVALARLLYHDLDVLLLDEPTRGIDVGSKASLYRLIDELAARGKAILLISSYLPELLGMADRIAVMRRGDLLEAMPASEATEESLLARAAV
ncbi:MAG TPA: sugar ABC transporter ATP-binding protein [Vicinamibacteria bacterium]|nr:sugar ABC transporter ATP-binding protein [Vicinamibacteria bacterium]